METLRRGVFACFFLFFSQELLTHIILGEIDEILQVDVVAVGFDIIVDEKVELVFDPVLEDEGKDASSQLQEEDQTQEHGKLGSAQRCKNKHTHTVNASLQSRTQGVPENSE